MFISTEQHESLDRDLLVFDRSLLEVLALLPEEFLLEQPFRWAAPAKLTLPLLVLAKELA